MNKRILQIVVLLCFSAALHVCIPVSCAEQMPESAGKDLSEILSDESFQPRGTKSSLFAEPIQEIKKWVFGIIRDVGKRLLEGLSKLSQLDISFPGSEFLLEVFQTIAEAAVAVWDMLSKVAGVALWMLVGGLVLYGLWRFYRALAPRFERFTKKDFGAGVSAVSEEGSLSIEELLSQGRVLDALCVLRQRIRGEFSREYGIEDSVTDRELGRSLPADESRVGLFRRIAAVFEECAFAGRRVRVETVTSLYDESVSTASGQEL